MAELNRSENIGSDNRSGDMVAAAMLRQVEAWTSTQGELLAGMETLWADWMRRQREALTASTQSLQQMFECRNLADLAQIQQRWLADTVRRAASDIGSLASGATALTCRLGGGERFEFPSRNAPAPGRGRQAERSESGALQREAAE